MARPRSQLISLSDTPYYHCVSRCVRRAFLCGTDDYSGQCFEHRRDWLEQKLLLVADVFAIKVCAYAIMSNHYHVVLKVRTDLAQSWSATEVAERWHRIFMGTPVSTKFLLGTTLSSVEQLELKSLISLWRERLTNISWLMRVVNEHIARLANAEDKCTGCFWEGRFKSQALLDEQALLACMAYVDLNPLRANMADTPESSEYTCIKKRIAAVLERESLPSCIEHFTGVNTAKAGIPFALKDYIDLVEWTAQIIHPHKSGVLKKEQPSLLDRLNIDIEAWKILTTRFEQKFGSWVGSEQLVQNMYKRHKYHRNPSTKNHRNFFG